jgi:hypothetical protein
MREIDYLRSLRDDGTALAGAAGRGLDPPVPACEGWTVADLVLHTGMVHRHKLEIVRGGLAQPPGLWPPPAPPRADLLLFLWGRAGAEPLERSGDPALLPRVRELAAAATQ